MLRQILENRKVHTTRQERRPVAVRDWFVIAVRKGGSSLRCCNLSFTINTFVTAVITYRAVIQYKNRAVKFH
jgi:hypothetical protein